MAAHSEKHPAKNNVNATPVDRLVPTLYEELRMLAHRKMRTEPPGQTLQATALVHEAYMRLLHNGSIRWNTPAHFFCAAAEAMRRILIERARRRSRLKHGGGLGRISIDDAAMMSGESPTELLALDAALDELQEKNPRKAQVVKLRYFTGLTIAETAETLGISKTTVKQDWVHARAWLHSAIANTPR